ncbi:hypothetical protein KKA15_03370 [Patescibacteria group bacterium]|nr:hypothetical protein [Patescibacteria group bacterium]
MGQGMSYYEYCLQQAQGRLDTFLCANNWQQERLTHFIFWSAMILLVVLIILGILWLIKKRKEIIILIAVITVILVTGIVALFFLTRPAEQPSLPEDVILSDDKISKCIRGGGTWGQFQNTCGDNCTYIRNADRMFCGQAFTDACNCGPDKCWNGEKCENN